jgi:hypothetical protein
MTPPPSSSVNACRPRAADHICMVGHGSGYKCVPWEVGARLTAHAAAQHHAVGHPPAEGPNSHPKHTGQPVLRVGLTQHPARAVHTRWGQRPARRPTALPHVAGVEETQTRASVPSPPIIPQSLHTLQQVLEVRGGGGQRLFHRPSATSQVPMASAPGHCSPPTFVHASSGMSLTRVLPHGCACVL